MYKRHTKKKTILQARLAGPGMDTMKASAKRQPNRGLWSSILEAFGGQVGPPGTKNGGGFSEKTAKHRPLELDFGGFWRPSWASRSEQWKSKQHAKKKKTNFTSAKHMALNTPCTAAKQRATVPAGLRPDAARLDPTENHGNPGWP